MTQMKHSAFKYLKMVNYYKINHNDKNSEQFIFNRYNNVMMSKIQTAGDQAAAESLPNY